MAPAFIDSWLIPLRLTTAVGAPEDQRRDRMQAGSFTLLSVMFIGLSLVAFRNAFAQRNVFSTMSVRGSFSALHEQFSFAEPPAILIRQ